MKVIPLLVVMAAVFACNLSYRLNIEKIVTDAETIRDGEAKYYEQHERYASLEELLNTGLAGRDMADGKDAGFMIEIEASDKHYVLSIYPDYSQGVVNREYDEQMSIFCDETGVLRVSLDPRVRADRHSFEMHPKY